MPLLFKKIYEKAINLFDDPVIQRAYVEDTVRWQKMMRPHLENGINHFTNPTKVSFLLVDQEEPCGQIDVIDGNGQLSYVCDESFVPRDGCDFSFLIGDQYDPGATYHDGVVTFTRKVPSGRKCSVEWYFGGQFNTDFSSAASSTTSSSVIEYKVMDILANSLVLSWAENEKNFLLDIRNLLTDTDFKLYSNANSIRAKIAWTENLQMNLDTQTNKLAWDVLSRKYHGGNYYG